GYFRPIIDDFKLGTIDNHINTMITHFELELKFEEAYAYTSSQVILKKNQDKEEEIISTIITKFKAIEERFDFVIVEGTNFSGEGALIEMDINVLIAKNLGIPAIIISSGVGKTLEEFVGIMHMAYDSFVDKGVQVISIIANKVQPENISLAINGLTKELQSHILIHAIPINPILINPSIKEIVETLDGKILFGQNHINNQAGAYSVGAMQLR